jgi:hypothetical protein
MIVSVRGTGDRSVGIFPHEFEFEYPDLENLFANTPEARESTRKILAEAIGEIEADKVGIYFEDECPDCRTAGYIKAVPPGFSMNPAGPYPGTPSHCSNPKCISNMPDPDLIIDPEITYDKLEELLREKKATLIVDHVNHREITYNGNWYHCGWNSKKQGDTVMGWIVYKVEAI